MVAARQLDYISPEDYLEGEKTSPIKHEYIDGQVYAMAGASDVHGSILVNIIALLRNHLRGKGCFLYPNDMKVQIPLKRRYYYPDLLVTCDRRDQETPYVKSFPTVIIEVLSDSTEAFDRGVKFADYRTIETLQEYVLVSQSAIQVEVFRRNQAGRWELYSFAAGDGVELASLGYSGAIETLYEDVVLRPNPESWDLD